MHLQSLIQLLRVARAYAVSHRLIVFGSGALLLSFPDLGERDPIQKSLDADVILDPEDDVMAGIILDGAGKPSRFSEVHGVYLDIIRMNVTENFPPGWKNRLLAVEGIDNAWSLEPHDVACAKLIAGRPKDMDVLVLLRDEGRIDIAEVRRRLDTMALEERLIVTVYGRLKELGRDVSGSVGPADHS